MLKWLPTHEEMEALLKKESDRGVILILAAYIEEILGLIISDACVSPVIAATLLRHDEPANTFGARLLLVEAFGFIHETEAIGLKKTTAICRLTNPPYDMDILKHFAQIEETKINRDTILTRLEELSRLGLLQKNTNSETMRSSLTNKGKEVYAKFRHFQ
jgi:hypothetical protein